MNPLDTQATTEFVNQNISRFHQDRVRLLESMDLASLLKKKNPYLFRAKNITTPRELVNDLLVSALSSSEEGLFGGFLEDLAIFIASQTCDARKSTAPGADFEFSDKDVYYVVSVKSGPNWGNKSQQDKQEQDFKDALKRLKQSRLTRNVQAVLGICYGKTRTSFLRGYMKVVGQSFWYFISEDEQLYQRIIEPLGDEARQYNDTFLVNRNIVVTRLAEELAQDYSASDGKIDWAKLIGFNSGNLRLENDSTSEAEDLGD